MGKTEKREFIFFSEFIFFAFTTQANKVLRYFQIVMNIVR